MTREFPTDCVPIERGEIVCDISSLVAREGKTP